MIYEYKCEKCRHSWESYRRYEERNSERCSLCGELAIKLLSNTKDVLEFTPAWFNDICEEPIYITSKKQLRDECKRHNVLAARLL